MNMYNILNIFTFILIHLSISGSDVTQSVILETGQ